MTKHHSTRRPFLQTMVLSVIALTLSTHALSTHTLYAKEPIRQRPNVLFCLSDDQSWPHASAYGDKVIKTPNFDRIAKDGVLFNHAYCAAPSCTASRSAILTGQHIWRLGQGGQLFGTLPKEHPVYTNLLAQAGYHVGYMAKGWAPGHDKAGGHTSNPAGKSYKTFQHFFDADDTGKPWCFWFGSRDPHRGYRPGSGVASGMDPQQVEVPGIFPDTPEVRKDICDYYWEIQRFDHELGAMLKVIEGAGQMENTIVVITSTTGTRSNLAALSVVEAESVASLGGFSWAVQALTGLFVATRQATGEWENQKHWARAWPSMGKTNHIMRSEVSGAGRRAEHPRRKANSRPGDPNR